jgi:hypothetical protein
VISYIQESFWVRKLAKKAFSESSQLVLHVFLRIVKGLARLTEI